MWIILNWINNILLLTYIGFTYNSDRKIEMDDWRRRYFIFISWFQIIYSIVSTFSLGLATLADPDPFYDKAILSKVKTVFPDPSSVYAERLQSVMERFVMMDKTPTERITTVVWCSIFGLFLELFKPIVILAYFGTSFSTSTKYLETDDWRRRFLVIISYLSMIFKTISKLSE